MIKSNDEIHVRLATVLDLPRLVEVDRALGLSIDREKILERAVHDGS